MPGERLWKIWWLWGIPVAWISIVLLLVAEQLRLNGWSGAGNLLDVARLAVYWYWCRLAWASSGNAGSPLLGWLSKTLLGAGLALTVLA